MMPSRKAASGALFCLCAAAMSLWPTASRAGDKIAVDVELVLAVDASFSVGQREQDIQRVGYIAAFRDPEVIEALTGGPLGRAAVAFVEWADADFQRMAVDWTLIDSAAAAHAFADQLVEAPIRRSGSTSISRALAFSAALFARNDYAGDRLVIDISGDGANNDGPPVADARDAVAALGVTINALPLLTAEASAAPVDLADYYRGCVISRPGGFSHPIQISGDIAGAIRRKMVMELANAPVIRADYRFQRVAAETEMDCLIGEKLRREEYLRMLKSITKTPERWAPDEKSWPSPGE